jgi:hypothetical protein
MRPLERKLHISALDGGEMIKKRLLQSGWSVSGHTVELVEEYLLSVLLSGKYLNWGYLGTRRC